MNTKKIAAIALTGLVSLATFPSPGMTQGFDPNNVLNDRTIRDHWTMDFWQISAFLNQKGGLGKRFDVDPNDGLLKGAAQLIYDASQRHRVNPQYLLVLLQKESSAVETANPSQGQLDFATGYGVCDSCAKDDPAVVRHRGLAKQIDSGAGFVDWFWNEGVKSPSLPKPGEARRIDGLTVTPANMATAALYAYTPHLHGNRLIQSIWNRWWGEGQGIGYPDGSLVRNEKTGQVGLVRAGKLRPITSPTVLKSRFAAVMPIDINEYDFAALAENTGPAIRLAEPSLARTEDGTVWLLVHGKKRRLASPAAFVKIGFNPEEVEDVTSEEIEDYPEGVPLTAESASPTGYLVQYPRSGGWWWFDNDERHALHDRALLDLAFRGQPTRTMSAAQIDLTPMGEPAIFPDGSLIKSQDDPRVYVISLGQRRPIASESTFVSLGYRWQDIRTVSPKALGLHPIGEEINLSVSE
ncbi:hypothetical protein JW899_04935 [Candidatus Uhrbacteria bacterium]|nr:hypothetical protein [Candidatus Uhrbacteria bacterium]